MLSTFQTACGHHDCLPSLVENLFDDWTITYFGMEHVVLPNTAEVISNFIVYLRVGDEQHLDYVDILKNVHLLVSTHWTICVQKLNQSLELKPDFYHPMEVAFVLNHQSVKRDNSECLPTNVANYANVKVVPAWTLDKQVEDSDLPLNTNEQSVYYLQDNILPCKATYLSKLGTDFIYMWPRRHIGHINKMHYCHQIFLKTNEFQLLYNGQLVYYLKRKRYLLKGEFRIHRDVMTRDILGVFICVEDFLLNSAPVLHITIGVIITIAFCVLACNIIHIR